MQTPDWLTTWFDPQFNIELEILKVPLEVAANKIGGDGGDSSVI